jgi:hypothetical protein
VISIAAMVRIIAVRELAKPAPEAEAVVEQEGKRRRHGRAPHPGAGLPAPARVRRPVGATPTRFSRQR